MAEKKENNTEKPKSGAGKFFLGAALGAIAGAIAGKFISTNIKDEEESEKENCACDKECSCTEKPKKQRKAEK